MPRLPPVTRAVLPAMSKRFEAVIGPLCPSPSLSGQCHGAAREHAGSDAQGLVLYEEGGAVVHPARPVRRTATDEEVATGKVAQELADIVARRDRRHAEDLVGADNDTGLGLDQSS